MFRKRTNVDWVFLSEEDQDMRWPPAPEASGDRSKPGKRQRFRRAILFGITMTFFLIAGIGAAYAHQEAIQGVKVIEQEVQAAVEAEQWVQHNAPQLAARVLVNDETSPYMKQVVARELLLPNANTNEGSPDPVLNVQHTWFVDDVAASELTLSEPATDGGTPMVYRQTRFYRETQQGWLRTQPDPMLWGKPLTLETDHLVWHYRQRDHAAVAAIADEMEPLYVRLIRDYGLTPSTEDDKQAIHVQVDALPGLILMYDSPPGPIVVTSPSIHLVPFDQSDTETLAQTVALALLKNVWAQAVAQHDIEESWPMMAGLSLWELWDMELSLSSWQDDIVQAIYGDAEAMLPARYREICAAHSIWITTPIAIGIPLYCTGSQDGEPAYSNILLADLKENNSQRQRMADLHHTILQPARLEDSFIMYTVIDYAVTAHGRERLPELVAALGQHDTWETLIPAVYDTSYEEFERGWRQHVTDLAR